MKAVEFQDKPSHFPTAQANGAALKPLTQVLLERRATPHFKPDPVPAQFLQAILRLGTQAPTGYNLQPARFIVVQKPENRKRLQQAAFDQPKVGEAPVVLIAFGRRGDWTEFIDPIFREGVRRGIGRPGHVEESERGATQFLDQLPANVWVNRHTMIVLTTIMLLAESYGLDTAPMEGFNPSAVIKEFGLPPDAEVVALLAIGFAQSPDKPYGGRLALHHVVFAEHYGQPWPTDDTGSTGR